MCAIPPARKIRAKDDPYPMSRRQSICALKIIERLKASIAMENPLDFEFYSVFLWLLFSNQYLKVEGDTV
jgi:hypothetical protein